MKDRNAGRPERRKKGTQRREGRKKGTQRRKGARTQREEKKWIWDRGYVGGRDGVKEGKQYYGILFSFALFWFVFLSPFFLFLMFLFLVLVLVLVFLAPLRLCVPFFKPSLLSLCLCVCVRV
jgi:hypothetical protein